MNDDVIKEGRMLLEQEYDSMKSKLYTNEFLIHINILEDLIYNGPKTHKMAEDFYKKLGNLCTKFPMDIIIFILADAIIKYRIFYEHEGTYPDFFHYK